ncbi:MAG: phytanoyl-CoA dioxygenase family protein [Gammaproteobacteria bacterium]|nr:phytanoyl-CoA dioxygenase family protein [Gammaproteobacteria bacterium]
MELSTHDVEQFRQRGYCVRPGFFDRAEIKRMSDWLDSLQTAPPREGAEACYYEQSPVTGDGMLVRVEHILGDHNPEMTRLMLAPKVLEALSSLFGETPVLFKEKVNYKLPGCRADRLHQDQAAGWNAYSGLFITMAIVVDANRRENAALSFLSTGAYARSLMGPEWQPLTDADPPYEPAGDYQVLEANPGDVVFFDSYVPHGSPANTSNQPRRNIYLTFNRQSDGDLRMRYYRDKWASYPPNNPGQARGVGSYRV